MGIAYVLRNLLYEKVEVT